jgi:hypothetical protein
MDVLQRSLEESKKRSGDAPATKRSSARAKDEAAERDADEAKPKKTARRKKSAA